MSNLTLTLTQISKTSGVPLRTLQRWKTTKPFVFAAVCEKVAWHKVIADAVADMVIDKQNKRESNNG